MDKIEAAKYKMELNIESFNAAHDALEEMYQMTERKVEWNVSDFTSLERALGSSITGAGLMSFISS